MDVWISEILAWIEEPATGWAPMGDWAQAMGLNQLPIVQEYALVIEVSSAPRAASREPRVVIRELWASLTLPSAVFLWGGSRAGLAVSAAAQS